MKMFRIISACIFLLSQFFAIAQDKEVELADEYFFQEEYEKAKSIYEKLAKNKSNTIHIYNKYTNTLARLGEFSEAEKYTRKLLKVFPDNIEYTIDNALFLNLIGKEKEAEKTLDRLIKDIATDKSKVITAAEIFIKRDQANYARDLFLAAREKQGKNTFSFELSRVYSIQGNVSLLIEELINYAESNKGDIETAKNYLQNDLTEENHFKLLEETLITRLQKNPSETTYNELLVWLYVQRKDFYKAYIQAKAIDRRHKLQGKNMIELGLLALENKDYTNAIKIFDYVVESYQYGLNYYQAKKLLINAKEEQVKHTLPVSDKSIRSLINDYKKLIKDVGNSADGMEARRSMALLYAFYLDQKDTAITILTEIINGRTIDKTLKAQSKIDLGDIYLLKGEPWESKLLYYQVEKDHKSSPIGYEAKLKNAKLSYFEGDFILAQQHLDILKESTTKEIANDAMNLSVFITDNLGLDTTNAILEEYAFIELMVFQNKIYRALRALESMKERFPYHTLYDDVLWMQARLYLKKGDYEKAIALMKNIDDKYGDGILGDDALYTMGKIYEEYLHEEAKAMDIYKNFMIKYSGSVFVADARRRFRKLRGDNIN